MPRLITFITDLLFPPSPDELTIRVWTKEAFATHHYSLRYITYGVALTTYKEPSISAAIHLAKFHNHPHAVDLLSFVLATHLHSLSGTRYLLIPMPLSKQRYRERGYNQVYEVAKRALTEMEHVEIHSDILIKRIATLPQTSLSKKERLKNQRNAFAVHPHLPSEIKNTPVLLVDDVYTTGTTMRSAYSTLQKAGFTEVSCIALSH